MSRAPLIIAGLAVAAIAFMGREQVKSAMVPTDEALNNKNVRAFLEMIKANESHGRYDLLFGGGTFADYSTHPNQHVPFLDPRTGKMTYSTAAGAYQILYRTWRALTLLPDAPKDFSPAAQDYFAVQLLKIRGALSLIIAGKFEEAVKKASLEWASLPGSPYGQPTKTMAVAIAQFNKAGGSIA